MLIDFLMNCWQKVALIFVQADIQVSFCAMALAISSVTSPKDVQ